MSLLYSFLWRRDGIVLQVLVRNSIVQQGDVLRNDDTLVSRHILISQFKTGVQNFLTGSLLDRQRGIVIERYGCKGESSHRGFGQASSTGPPEIQGSRELVVSEMTNNGSMEMVKETTSYAREFGIGITVSCAGPDSEEYSTRNEASSCLRNVIERNPLGGMRSLGNEGAGPTDRHLRVQRSRRDQRLSRRPTAQHQPARTVIDHRFRRCLSCGKHVSIPDDHQAAIRSHRQTMHRSDSRSVGRKGGPELLHSSHTACRTRQLRIAITAVTCNGTQRQLPRSTHAYAICLCHKHLLLFTRWKYKRSDETGETPHQRNAYNEATTEQTAPHEA